MMTTSFQALPSLMTLYMRALFKRNQKQLTALPELTLKVSDFAINTVQFSQYLESFGFEGGVKIPAPFFYLATQTSQLFLMTRSEFPLSPAGLVHLGVCFEQQDALLTQAWENSSAGMSKQIKSYSFSFVANYTDSTEDPEQNVDRSLVVDLMVAYTQPLGPRTLHHSVRLNNASDESVMVPEYARRRGLNEVRMDFGRVLTYELSVKF